MNTKGDGCGTVSAGRAVLMVLMVLMMLCCVVWCVVCVCVA